VEDLFVAIYMFLCSTIEAFVVVVVVEREEDSEFESFRIMILG
jgi:hypothetical protein